MSLRHHRPSQPITQPIPWLEHRTGFPSDTERQALIRRREALQAELLPMPISAASGSSIPMKNSAFFRMRLPGCMSKGSRPALTSRRNHGKRRSKTCC
jgi:hypothetical protein